MILGSLQFVWRISLRARVLREIDCLPRTKQRHWCRSIISISNLRNTRGLEVVARITNVTHVNSFNLTAVRFLWRQVFHDDHAARHLHQEVRFGGHDERERLKWCRDVDLRIDKDTAAAFDLAEVVDVSIR